MPIEEIQDVLNHPDFKAADAPTQANVLKNYWAAYDKENPDLVKEIEDQKTFDALSREQGGVVTDQSRAVSPRAEYIQRLKQNTLDVADIKLKQADADPVTQKALEYQRQWINADTTLTINDQLGGFETPEARKAFVEETQQSLSERKLEAEKARLDFQAQNDLNSRKAAAKNQVLTTFSDKGYYPALTSALSSAWDTEFTKLSKEDGKWVTPLMQPVAGKDANILERRFSGVSQVTASLLARRGHTTDRFDLALKDAQEKSGLSDSQFQQVWGDIGNNLRAWEPEEKVRTNSDGQLVMNPAASEFLDPEKANALIDQSNASWYGKKAAKERVEQLGVEQASNKLEAYEAASQVLQLGKDNLSNGKNDTFYNVDPLISPSQWAQQQGRKDLGTPSFIKDYEDNVVNQQGTGSKWVRGISTDFILGFNQLANTITGLGGIAGSDKAAELSAQGAEAGSIIGQGKTDTGLTGQVVQQLPSLAAQVVAAQVTGGASVTLLGETSAARGLATLGTLATAGAQSAGMTYAQQRAEGDNHEVAQQKAVDSGLSTAIITGGFEALGNLPGLKGLGGVEGSLVNATVGDLKSAVGVKVAQAGMKKFASIALGVVGEFGEESVDQITQSFLTADKDTNLATAWREAWQAGLVGGLFGGGATAIETALDTNKPTYEQTDEELERNATETLTEKDLLEDSLKARDDADASYARVAELRKEKDSLFGDTDADRIAEIDAEIEQEQGKITSYEKSYISKNRLEKAAQRRLDDINQKQAESEGQAQYNTVTNRMERTAGDKSKTLTQAEIDEKAELEAFLADENPDHAAFAKTYGLKIKPTRVTKVEEKAAPTAEKSILPTADSSNKKEAAVKALVDAGFTPEVLSWTTEDFKNKKFPAVLERKVRGIRETHGFPVESQAEVEGGDVKGGGEPAVAKTITRSELVTEIELEKARLERLGAREIQGPDGKMIPNPDQRILTTDENDALKALQGTPEEVAKAFGLEIVEKKPTPPAGVETSPTIPLETPQPTAAKTEEKPIERISKVERGEDGFNTEEGDKKIVAELDSLPVGASITDRLDNIWTKNPDGTWSATVLSSSNSGGDAISINKTETSKAIGGVLAGRKVTLPETPSPPPTPAAVSEADDLPQEKQNDNQQPTPPPQLEVPVSDVPADDVGAEGTDVPTDVGTTLQNDVQAPVEEPAVQGEVVPTPQLEVPVSETEGTDVPNTVETPVAEPYSVESLKTTFELTDEQAVVAKAIGDALGARVGGLIRGGVPGEGALRQENDADYIAAVESGDMVTAEKLVNGARKTLVTQDAVRFPFADKTLGVRRRGAEGHGAWLLPGGSLILVPDNHARTALKYFPNRKNSLESSQSEAFGAGWVLLRAHPKGTYRSDTQNILTVAGKTLTKDQRRNAEDWAIMHDYTLDEDLAEHYGRYKPVVVEKDADKKVIPLSKRFGLSGPLFQQTSDDSKMPVMYYVYLTTQKRSFINKEDALRSARKNGRDKIEIVYADGSSELVSSAENTPLFQSSGLSDAEYARHAELEARKDNLTPEERKEAEAIVEKAARIAGFVRVEGNDEVDPDYLVPVNEIYPGREKHVASMAREFAKSGKWNGRPILKIGDRALTGSHRIFAARRANEILRRAGRDEFEIPTFELSESEAETFDEWIQNDGEGETNAISYADFDSSVGDDTDKASTAAKALEAGVIPIEFEALLRAEELSNLGNDFDQFKGNIYASPSQIKSADPFTGVPLRERFNPENPSILYQYAGENANTPQFMRDSLETAKTMAAEGKTSEEIRAVTGWFPGPEGKMRWEIPDDGATWNQFIAGPSVASVRLGDFLKHDALFAAYPDLADVPLRMSDTMPSNMGASFDPTGLGQIEVNNKKTDAEKISSVLHEVQHWIQKRENFAKGTSPDTQAYDQQFALSPEDATKVAEIRAKITELTDQKRDLDNANRRGEGGWQMVSRRQSQMMRLDGELDLLYRDERNTNRTAREKFGFDRYQRAAGEMEARDVQARRTLTPEQRKATAPYSSENIAPDQLIILQQNAKGSFEITEDGKILLRGLQSPDFTTAVHEISHAARRNLDQILTPDEVSTVQDWAGAKDGKWDVAAEEKFARGWERYFAEGKAPLASLQPIFDKIAKWMLDVYKSIKGSEIDVEITPEVRAVFDKMASRLEQPNKESAPQAEGGTVDGKLYSTQRAYMDALRAKYEMPDYVVNHTTGKASVEEALVRLKATEDFDKGKGPAPTNNTGQALVAELSASGRAANPVENALLLHEVMQLEKDLEEANRKSENNPVYAGDAENAWSALAATAEVISRQGTLAGQSLEAFKKIMANQFSVANLTEQAIRWKKKANPDAKLDDTDKALIQKTAKEAAEKFQKRDAADNAKELDDLDRGAQAIYEAILNDTLTKEEIAARFVAQQKVIDDLESELGVAEVEKAEKDAAIVDLTTIKEATKAPGRLLETLSNARDAAKARMDARKREGRLNALPLPDVLDASIIGAYHIANGVKKLSDFKKVLASELGDWVKAHIKDIFKQSKALLGASVRESKDGKLLASPQDILNKIDSDKDLKHKDVYNMFVGHLRSGMRGHKEILEKITEDLKTLYPKITYLDVTKAFTNYGVSQKPSGEQLAVLAREGHALALKETQLAELNAKGEIERTGRQAGDMTPETEAAIRKLDADIEATYKRLNITRVSDKALKSPTASAKTRMRNEIADRKRALEEGRKLVNKDNPPLTDDELKQLEEELRELRDVYNYVFKTTDAAGEAQRVTRLLNHLDKQRTKANEMLANGILQTDTKKKPAEHNADVLAAKARLAEIHADRISALKALNPTKTRAQLAYDAALRSNKEGLKRDKEIAATGVLPTKKTKAPLYTVEGELKTILDERGTYVALIAEIRANARSSSAPSPKEVAKAIKAAEDIVAGLDKRVEQLQKGVIAARRKRNSRFASHPEVLVARKKAKDRRAVADALERRLRSKTPPTPEEIETAVAKAEAAEKAVDARIRKLEGGELPAPKTPTLISQVTAVADARRRVKERLAVEASLRKALDEEGLDKRRIRAAENRAARYQAKIDAKDFSTARPPDKKLSEAAAKARYEADKVAAEWQKQRAAYLFAARPALERGATNTLNFIVSATPLALVGDVLILRQGEAFTLGALAPRIPDAVRAYKRSGPREAFKALFGGYPLLGSVLEKAWTSALSGDHAYGYSILTELRNHPNVIASQSTKRPLHLIDPLREQMLTLEGAPTFEALETLAKLKVPLPRFTKKGIKLTPTNIRGIQDVAKFVQGIERFGITYANLAKFHKFNASLDVFGSEKAYSTQELEAAADLAGIFTGRGAVAPGEDTERAVGLLNKVAYISFRFTLAEIQRNTLVVPLYLAYRAGSYRAAGKAFSEFYIRTVIGRAIFNAVFAAFMPEDEEDKDRFKALSFGIDIYDDKNLGKLNVYGIKADPFLGAGKYASIMIQAFTNKTYMRGKLVQDTKSSGTSITDKALRTIIKSNNLFTSKVISQFRREDFAGNRLSLTDKEGLINSVKMWTQSIVINDSINIYQQHGPAGFVVWVRMMMGDKDAGEFFKNDYELMLEFKAQKAAEKKASNPYKPVPLR